MQREAFHKCYRTVQHDNPKRFQAGNSGLSFTSIAGVSHFWCFPTKRSRRELAKFVQKMITKRHFADPAKVLQTTSPEQTGSLHQTNAIVKPGIRLYPTDRSAIRKCTFGVPLKQHILFLRCGKVPYAPLLPEQEEPVSFPKKWKERTFSVRKRRKLLL